MLTPAQKEARLMKLLAYLEKRIEKDEISPPLKDMVEFMGAKSVSTVHKLLVDLEALGHITWEQGCKRSIRIVRGVQNA